MTYQELITEHLYRYCGILMVKKQLETVKIILEFLTLDEGFKTGQ